MRKHLVLGAAIGLIAALTLAACGKSDDDGPAAQAAKDVEAIKATETQWVSDLKDRNVEAVVGHYTASGVLLLPGETPTKGSDQLRYVWRLALGDPAYSLTFKPDRVEVAAAGDLAYTEGTYSLTATDQATHKPVTATGAYVTVYKKTANGSWKAVEDIATTNTTQPAAPTAPPTPGKASSGTDVSAEADALRTQEVQWAAAWKARDAAKIAAVYAPDAVALQPDIPAMVGTQAISTGLGEALKDTAYAVDFKADVVTVSASGDLAYTRGSYTSTATDPKTHKPVEQKGAYVTVYRRMGDGSWKAVADIASPGPKPLAPVVAAK